MARKVVPVTLILGVLVAVAILFGVYYWVTKSKYIMNPSYCERDSDCVVSADNCRAINKYNFKKPKHKNIMQCEQITCGAYCENNRCRLKSNCG